jgi:hypothetical protein
LIFRHPAISLELVTEGQRLHRYEDSLSARAARNLSPEPHGDYA